MPASSRSDRVGRRFRGVSAEQRVRRRREQLLEAGLEMFGTRGFHAVGVRDICAEAKLTERYFYESFANREALFSAVYERAVARVREAISSAISEAPPQLTPMARAGLRAYLETLQAEPRMARILLIDVLSVGADAGNQSLLATRSFADLVRAMMQELYPGLDHTHLEAQLLANGLVGSTLFLVMQWAFNGFQEPLEHILEHCVLFYEALGAHVLNEASPAGGQ